MVPIVKDTLVLRGREGRERVRERKRERIQMKKNKPGSRSHVGPKNQ